MENPALEAIMSDPLFKDPRLDTPVQEDEIRRRRMAEMEGSNAMWGWIAGAVVLALVLVFIFARGQSTDTTASNVPSPPVTTGVAPPAGTPPVATPRPTPSTTGQGTPR
jgi:hypothetical protein